MSHGIFEHENEIVIKYSLNTYLLRPFMLVDKKSILCNKIKNIFADMLDHFVTLNRFLIKKHIC